MNQPTTIPNGTPVGKYNPNAQIAKAKVVQYGIIRHSRPIELNGNVVEIVYSVDTSYTSGEIFFHDELTTDCEETASQRGH